VKIMSEPLVCRAPAAASCDWVITLFATFAEPISPRKFSTHSQRAASGFVSMLGA
jgi:hypothetical protein